MKRNLVLLYLFIAIISISNLDGGYAPKEPCLPDCENSDWIPAWPNAGGLLIISLCDIDFEVYYRYRNACNIWYDYYIEFAGTTNYEDDIADCIDSYGSMNAFLQAITEQLIIINPANFPPHPPDSCNSNWRVLKGGCWYQETCLCMPGQPNPPKYWRWIESCGAQDCCLEYFTVCITEQGRTITQTGYLPPLDPNCENTTLPPPLDEILCKPVCGSIYD